MERGNQRKGNKIHCYREKGETRMGGLNREEDWREG